MSLPITLHPVTSADWPAIARVECAAFWDDEFTQVAFGPLRGTDEALRLRVKSLEKPSKNRQRWVKAVLNGDAVEEGEVVGFAVWSFVGDNAAGNEVRREEGKDKKEETKEEDEDEEGSGGWGLGANVKFCEDVFLPADDFMLRDTKGKSYAKLYNIAILPQYQRKGIGTLFLQEGLQVVDDKGLQTVLGASAEGEGLYRRFGFVETEVMELKLWEYEGGEGMGKERHVIMWRPPKGGVDI